MTAATHYLRGILGAWPLVLAASCADEAGGPPPMSSIAARQPPVISLKALDEDWDYYAADITLKASGGDPLGTKPSPARVYTHRTERVLSEDGWTTTNTYSDLGAAAYERRRTIAKMVVHPNGRRDLFDRDGRRIDLPSRGDMPASMRERFPTLPSAPSTRAKPQSTGLRDWIDNIVVGPTSRARIRARAERAFGAPIGLEASLLRFRMTVGGRTHELLLDEGRGVIVEERVFTGRALVQTITYAYSEVGPETFLRTGVRIERAPEGVGLRPRVMEQFLSNVTIERRGSR